MRRPPLPIASLVVVHDVGCAACSEIARELPDLVRVPVRVRSCRDPQLRAGHPELPADVTACRTPALGLVRRDGTVRWWRGLTGSVAVLPVVRPARAGAAVVLLWRALRAR